MRAAHHIIGDCKRLLEDIEGLPPSAQREEFARWVNEEGWNLGLDEEQFANARELIEAEEREAHQEERADQAVDRIGELTNALKAVVTIVRQAL